MNTPWGYTKGRQESVPSQTRPPMLAVLRHINRKVEAEERSCPLTQPARKYCAMSPVTNQSIRDDTLAGVRPRSSRKIRHQKLDPVVDSVNGKTWETWYTWTCTAHGCNPWGRRYFETESKVMSFERMPLITRRSEVRILPPLMPRAHPCARGLNAHPLLLTRQGLTIKS